MTTPSNDFVKANTPESRELDVEGDHFAAHHIGGTTWRFGSGDEAKDDHVGTITLAPHGATEYGLANARWIVHALDQVKQQARADERRRIDRAAENFGSFYAAMMVSPVTLEQINGEQRVVEGATLTKALFAATTNEGTDQ